jgi:hypothetical protein
MSALEEVQWALAYTGEGQVLRRRRVVQGAHRTWEILPRIGSCPDAPHFDRWTVVGTPIPGPTNPAADIEDGQFPDLLSAGAALRHCLLIDDGTHQEVQA